MDCQNASKYQFLLKRHQVIRQNHRNRREQIFNQTRKILTDSQNLQTQLYGKNQTHLVENQQTTKNHHDKLIFSSVQEEIHEQPKNKNKKLKEKGKRKYQYYKNFQCPDWMVHIPQNLLQFYFSIRPAGDKVFLNFKKNKIQIISLYGIIIKTVQIGKNTYHKTLLQGYYLKNQNLIMISDLLVWKQNPMSSSEFQFRISWMLSNFSQNIINSLIDQQNIIIKLIDYLPVNEQNIVKIYKQACKSQTLTDGLLFYHKDSFYLHQLNPDVLLWKDSIIAPILNKQFEKQKVIQKQKLMTEFEMSKQNQGQMICQTQQQIQCQNQLNSLNLNQKTIHFYGQIDLKSNILYSYDRIPLIKLSKTTLEAFIAQKKYVYSKLVIKFSFEEIYERNCCSTNNQNLNFQFQQKENYKKWDQSQNFPYEIIKLRILSLHQPMSRVPDCLSKIIFKYKYNSRENTPSIENILSQIQDEHNRSLSENSIKNKPVNNQMNAQ